MKRTKTSLILNRLLAGLGGIVVILLAGAPFCLVLYIWITCGSQGNVRIVALFTVTVALFGGIVVLGAGNVVRRWREVAEVQRMVGEMSDEEREEFYSAAEQGDVELAVDDKGRTHSSTSDFG